MSNQQTSKLDPQGDTGKGVFMTLFSSVLFLYVIGVFLMFSLHRERIIQFFKEKTNIVVELQGDIAESDIKDLNIILQKNANIKPGSVRFISREQALNNMKSVLGDSDLLNDEENPFRDVYTFNVFADFANRKDIDRMARELKRQPMVEDVFAQTEYLSYWDTWRKRINRMILLVGGLLLIVAVSLIFNTIQTHIQSKKYAINLMQLIGATWGFIRFPFYRKSFKYAVTSAILGSILIGASAIFVLYKVPEMGAYLDPLYILLTLCILLVLALVIHLGSTHYLLNRYLKDR